MNTAIIINLDYENLPPDECRSLWDLIESRMIQAGFVKNNRIFTTDMDPETAFTSARRMADDVFEERLIGGASPAHFLKEFYGIPCTHIADLSAPSAQEIVVDEADEIICRDYFGTACTQGPPQP